MFDVLIGFIDGSRMTITGAMGYKVSTNRDLFIVEKDGFNMFFQKDYVAYIGRKDDFN